MFESVKKPLLAFFKRCFPGAAQPSRPESGLTSSEQRGFDRYPVSFPVLVSGSDTDLAPFEEKSRLQDVSGNGAMFITKNPALYFPGQFLRLSILLDASEDVQARISNEAHVVRIDRQDSSSLGASRQAGIAVEFDCTFDFQRIDPGRGGFSE